MIHDSYATNFSDLSITLGENCNGTTCIINNIEYFIQDDGNIVAFYGSSRNDVLAMMYRFANSISAKYGINHGDFACIPHGKERFIKACLSIAGKNYRTAAFTNGDGYVFR
ncbi:MAG: hypothetical protein LBG46_05200 [Elusimicrobiota bacterium]|nr:hypothetical protein [Elusimicrobiota bacterium]